MTKRDQERVYRAINRLKRRGNQHPTDQEVSNEAAISVTEVEAMRKRLQKDKE